MDALKSSQLESWTRVAPGWKKHDELVKQYSMGLNERMLAHVQPGQSVLDIASGTGEPAIPAAERVGPKGRVLGLDFVEEMLAFAREKAARRGLRNLEFRCVDGEQFDVPAASFDAVTMRWGLMFMARPDACLTRVLRALKNGGHLSLACWAAPDLNPWASLPIAVIGRHLDVPTPQPEAPGLFAFANGERLRATIEEAGFTDIRVEPVELTMADFDTGEQYVNFTVELAGSIAMLLAKLPPERRAPVKAEIATEAERVGKGRAVLKGVTWLATARC